MERRKAQVMKKRKESKKELSRDVNELTEKRFKLYATKVGGPKNRREEIPELRCLNWFNLFSFCWLVSEICGKMKTVLREIIGMVEPVTK